MVPLATNALRRLLPAAVLILGVAGCSAGVGVRIPGTPVSVGASAPLTRPRAAKPEKMVYYQFKLDTVPSAARVSIGGKLAGSTPMTITLPFTEREAKQRSGIASILVEKPGYLPEGVDLFPVKGGVSRAPKGKPLGSLTIQLRPEQP